MATGRFPTETAERERDRDDSRDERAAGAPVRPHRAARPRRVAPGRVAMGVANYDRIAVRPVASV